jgi:hypothetical protein
MHACTACRNLFPLSSFIRSLMILKPFAINMLGSDADRFKKKLMILKVDPISLLAVQLCCLIYLFIYQ